MILVLYEEKFSKHAKTTWIIVQKSPFSVDFFTLSLYYAKEVDIIFMYYVCNLILTIKNLPNGATRSSRTTVP